MEWLETQKVALFDIETNLIDEDAIDAAKSIHTVWCATIYDWNAGELLEFGPNDIIKFLDTLRGYDVIIGHHIIGFDLAVLQHLYGYDSSHQIVFDTLVMSKLMFHNIKDLDYTKLIKTYSIQHNGENKLIEGLNKFYAAEEIYKTTYGKNLPTKRENYSPEQNKFIKDAMEGMQLVKDPCKHMQYNSFRNKSNSPMVGFHGLEAWGFRLKYVKMDFPKEQFDIGFTEEMMKYCGNDVEGPNLSLFNLMVSKEFPLDPILLECEVQRVILKQQILGWKIDVELAKKILGELLVKRSEITEDLTPKYDQGWEVELKTPEYYTANVNGKCFKALTKQQCEDKLWAFYKGQINLDTDKKWLRKDLNALVVSGPNKRKPVPITLGSGDHISTILMMKYGWKPTQFSKVKLNADGTYSRGDTYSKTSPLVKFYNKPDQEGAFKPKLDTDVLDSFISGNEKYDKKYESEVVYLCKRLKELEIYQDRIEKLSEGAGGGYLGFEREGRLHGRVDPLGAVTHRATHNKPHLGQVPAGRTSYGEQFRNMFVVPKGYKLCGTDADALEMRNLASNLAEYDGGMYARAVDEGKKADGTDPHTINMRAINKVLEEYKLKIDRDQAKTTFYAWIYGAMDGTLGTGVGAPRNKAREIGAALREGLESGITGMSELLLKVLEEHNALGYVTLVDDRKIYTRKESAALNSLLQAEGAIICKRWMVYIDYIVREKGLDAKQVGWIHDEVQVQVKDAHVEEFMKIPPLAMKLVEEYFDYKCPLKCGVEVGDTWNDTH